MVACLSYWFIQSRVLMLYLVNGAGVSYLFDQAWGYSVIPLLGNAHPHTWYGIPWFYRSLSLYTKGICCNADSNIACSQLLDSQFNFLFQNDSK